MSIESVRARLDAGPAIIEITDEPLVLLTPAERLLLVHAHTDLRLALDVIEAAKHHLESSYCWDGDGHTDLALKAALDAFEAAP